MYQDWGYPSYREDVMRRYRPARRQNDREMDEALSQLRADTFFAGWDGPDVVSSVLEAGQRLGATDYFVWGPRLVRAVLSPDVVSHRRRSREQRSAFAEALRRIIHYGHHIRDLDPAWQRLTDEAFEEARAAFVAGAPTEAELERVRRRDHLRTLVGAHDIEQLDTEPLALPELDLSGAEEEIRERVERLDAMIGQALAVPGTPLADEVRAAGRRLLVEAAIRHAAMFRRSSRDDNLAAGVAIVVAEGNGLGSILGLSRQEIAGRLGVTGVAAERGRTVATHAGVRLLKAPERRGDEVDVWRDYVTVIAHPRFQTSATRQLIRDAWQALTEPKGRACADVTTSTQIAS